MAFLVEISLIKYDAFTLFVVAIWSTSVFAGDGPINSSLLFFTKYRSLTPTPYSTVRSDAQTGARITTYSTKDGVPVLRQEWFPTPNDGNRKVHNEIFDDSGHVRIIEDLLFTDSYSHVQIRTYGNDHKLIVTRICDGYGHAPQITDSAAHNISEVQYAGLLRAALTTPKVQ
jgi:hypothetical protein